MSYLADLEAEREEDIVIWYGGDGRPEQPHGVLSALEALHGSALHPTLIPCHGRPDLQLLRDIFSRYELDLLHHPLIFIGNQPIVGDEEGLEELRSSGKLAEMMGKIGWVKKEEKKTAWKPKWSKAKKRELSEVEHALAKK